MSKIIIIIHLVIFLSSCVEKSELNIIEFWIEVETNTKVLGVIEYDNTVVPFEATSDSYYYIGSSVEGSEVLVTVIDLDIFPFPENTTVKVSICSDNECVKPTREQVNPIKLVL